MIIKGYFEIMMFLFVIFECSLLKKIEQDLAI